MRKPRNELPWNHFWGKDRETETMPEGIKERVLSAREAHVNRFRAHDWREIVRSLEQDYSLVVPEGLEPHWVDTGRAILWQEQFKRDITRDKNGSQVVTEKSYGWEPCGPLPVDTASQIANHLKRGLRFRPPGKGRSVEASQPADSSDGDEAEKKPPLYRCLHTGNNEFGFDKWEQYIMHCGHHGEVPDMTNIPRRILEQANRHVYFCYVHNVGFNSERLARQHIKRPHFSKKATLSLEEMRVGQAVSA